MPSFQLTSPDGKKYRVDAPEGATQEQAYNILQQQLDSQKTGWDVAGEEALGAGKGLLQGLGGVLAQVPGLGTPSVQDLDPRVKEFVNEKSQNAGQALGQTVGGALPFMIGGPEVGIGKAIAGKALPYLGRFAAPLGEIAAHALTSGVAGGAQPADSWQDRLKNTGLSMAAGAVGSPPVAGHVAGLAASTSAAYGLEQLARKVGWPVVFGALSPAAGAGYHYGLWKLAQQAYKAGSWPGRFAGHWLPAGFKGTAATKAGEAYLNPDALGWSVTKNPDQSNGEQTQTQDK